MKRKIVRITTILILLTACFFADRETFMKKRVTQHTLWQYDLGEKIHGDFIDTSNAFFKRDTLFFFNAAAKDTLLLDWQYFDTMKVTDPKTGKSGKYNMKGAYWTDYCWITRKLKTPENDILRKNGW